MVVVGFVRVAVFVLELELELVLVWLPRVSVFCCCGSRILRDGCDCC